MVAEVAVPSRQKIMQGHLLECSWSLARSAPPSTTYCACAKPESTEEMRLQQQNGR